MKKYISKFHYLTQDLPDRSHIQQAEIACSAGANWLQYRCFSKADEELLADLHQIAAICDEWGATLIVTDHYHLIDKADVQGVHIEDMQADWKAIREKIGPEKTLGASANSVQDIQRIIASGVVDYIGCGPFTFTSTKPNSFPTLGVEGYIPVVQAAGELPILAVGGIQIDDITPLIDTGIHGIAISAAVNTASNPYESLREIYRRIF
jgi:thiamine-phosphate pyrophosphorylase